MKMTRERLLYDLYVAFYSARKGKGKRSYVLKWEKDSDFLLKMQKAGKWLDKKMPKRPVSSERLVGMMEAMAMKYGVIFTFCHPDKTGEEVYRILTGGESQLLTK